MLQTNDPKQSPYSIQLCLKTLKSRQLAPSVNFSVAQFFVELFKQTKILFSVSRIKKNLSGFYNKKNQIDLNTLIKVFLNKIIYFC